jgi:hypothetical protein
MILNAATLAGHDLPPGDPSPPPDPIDLRPASAYEAITRQMVESLTEELREIKSRLNSLIFMMVGAILLDVLSRALAS